MVNQQSKVYIAWRDTHDYDSQPELIGVFATEELARALCGSESETYYSEHEVESTARAESWRDIYVCCMDKDLRRNSGGTHTYAKLLSAGDHFRNVEEDESWVSAQSTVSMSDAIEICQEKYDLAKERGEVYVRPLPDGIMECNITMKSIIGDGFKK